MPHTGHAVGAALLAGGRIHAAPNVEIVTLQQTVDAERNAVNVAGPPGTPDHGRRDVRVELPDNAAAIAITTAGNTSGKFTIHATALLTLEEIDEAVRLSVDFRSPGAG